MTRDGTVIDRLARARGAALAVLLAAVLAGGAQAAAVKVPVPDSLKRSAMGCLAETLRLCPDALAAKDHGVSCILGKRRQLSRDCQGLAEQALRFLNGQDVHIDLRPKKPH